MRKKINFFVLFIVLASNILVITLSLIFFQYRNKNLIEQEKNQLDYQLAREFKSLESILTMIERQVYVEYEEKIVFQAAQLSKAYPNGLTVPTDTLKKIAYVLGVEQIYLANREGEIIQTTSASEQHLNLKGHGTFQQFYDNLFISHTFNAMKFGYGPNGKRLYLFAYIVNEHSPYAMVCAIGFIDFLKSEYPGILNSWEFYNLNNNIPKESGLVEKLDVYVCTGNELVSVFNPKQSFVIDSVSFQKLVEQRQYSSEVPNGEIFYQIFTYQSGTSNLITQMVLQMNFNYKRYYESKNILVVVLSIALLLSLILIAFISPFVIERVLLSKIAIINNNLTAIGNANYNQIKTFTGSDELSVILSHVTQLNESVLKREEQLNVAKVQAEVADKLKSAFLANMSHEIRTPLNAVVGFAQLLRDANPSPEDIDRYVGLINANSTRLLQLISDIIDLSQIESGLMKIIPRPVCLDELFSELYASANSKIYNQNQIINNKNISVEIKRGELLSGECITTDPYRLKQILDQLIDNAVKFTCKGKITIGYELKEPYIGFFVQDTGVGVAHENLSRIFERFVQAEDYLTRQYGGTGLGLAICQELAQMLGGKIEVESQVNMGSTFWFMLPYRRSPKT